MNEQLRNTPKQPRSHKTLSSLAESATALYNEPEVGRDRLTTAMVAKLSGVSIGTFYRYFPSRYELLEHIAPHRDQSSI